LSLGLFTYTNDPTSATFSGGQFNGQMVYGEIVAPHGGAAHGQKLFIRVHTLDGTEVLAGVITAPDGSWGDGNLEISGSVRLSNIDISVYGGQDAPPQYTGATSGGDAPGYYGNWYGNGYESPTQQRRRAYE
jgi:hypothetical protein